MIKLHQFPRFFGLPNASPFCVKVECWLRMTDMEYHNVWVTNPSSLPKGKAPVIEHDGRLIADSTFIIEYLREHFSPHLDAHLSAREHAAAHGGRANSAGPLIPLPCGRQLGTEELGAIGGRQDDLTVGGLGDVGVGSRVAGNEVRNRYRIRRRTFLRSI